MEDDYSPDKLLHVEWDDQTERTNMTQALEGHREMLEKPGKTVRFVDGSIGDYEQLLDDLVRKVSSDKISIYDVSEDERLETTVITFKYDFEAIPDNVELENLADFAIQNQGGKQVNPDCRTYQVSRNGHAQIDYEAKDSSLAFEIEGHEAVAESYRGELEETLQQVEEGLF